MSDKMREAFEEEMVRLGHFPDGTEFTHDSEGAYIHEPAQIAWEAAQWAALTQQPESEPVAKVQAGITRGKFGNAQTVLTREEIPAGTELYIGPQHEECDPVADLIVSENGTSASYRIDPLSVLPLGIHKLYPRIQPTPQVPEGWKETIRLAQHLVSRSSDYRGPEVFARLEDLLSAAPSIAEKREWINCMEERVPTEADGDDFGNVWYCRPYFQEPKMIQVSEFPRSMVLIDDMYWMPTGLLRPEPPATGGND